MSVRRFRKRVLRTIVISVVAGTLASVAVFVGAYIAFPLEGVNLRGERMLQKSEVEGLVSKRSSLLTLNTRSLEQEIETNPWVESATVERDWRKHEVVIDVKEHRAVLLASVEGRERILASDGAALPDTGGARLSPVELERWQVPAVLESVRTLEAGGANLESVDSFGAEGITATVDGRRVILSDTVRSEQASALGEVMRQNPNSPYFDLRSPGRIVVGPEDKERDGDREAAGA